MESKLAQLEEITKALFSNNDNIDYEDLSEYKTILQLLPLCIHEIDKTGKLIKMNRAGLDMLNLKNESGIKGVPYMDYVCSKDKLRINRLLLDSLSNGRVHKFIFTSINGKVFSSCFTPLHKDDVVYKLVGYTYDISEF